MRKSTSIAVINHHPILVGFFLFATLLTLFLLFPLGEASGGHASGCPYMAKSSSQGCPYSAEMGGSGCPHMAGARGTGCPYLSEAKGCLHALKDSLKLDEEQMGKVQEIQGKFLEESADLKNSIQETSDELDRLFRDPDASADEISGKRKSLADLREQLEAMAMDFRLKIRGELTDEQLRQIPEGCWHGILAHGHGKKWGCRNGCKCPHKAAHSDVST
jgi:hypothetical protein